MKSIANSHGVFLSQSEGVIEFRSAEDFQFCIKNLDHVKLDGHYVRVIDEREYNRRKLKANETCLLSVTAAARRRTSRSRSRGRTFGMNRNQGMDRMSRFDRDRGEYRDRNDRNARNARNDRLNHTNRFRNDFRSDQLKRRDDDRNDFRRDFRSARSPLTTRRDRFTSPVTSPTLRRRTSPPAQGERQRLRSLSPVHRDRTRFRSRSVGRDRRSLGYLDEAGYRDVRAKDDFRRERGGYDRNLLGIDLSILLCVDVMINVPD